MSAMFYGVRALLILPARAPGQCTSMNEMKKDFKSGEYCTLAVQII